MNLWAKEYSWKGWQFSLLKSTMLAMGILLGVYFTNFWASIFWLVWVVFIVGLILTLAMWFKTMKKK